MNKITAKGPDDKQIIDELSVKHRELKKIDEELLGKINEPKRVPSRSTIDSCFGFPDRTKTDVIIIRGAPAVGKSTLAHELLKRFPGYAVMDVDDIRGMISKVDWHNEQMHIAALKVSYRMTLEFRRNGYTPVLVDTFYKWVIEEFAKKLEKDHLRYKIFTLYAEEQELIKRVRNRRGYDNLEVIHKLNQEAMEMKLNHEKKIDNTQMLVVDTLSMIIKEIAT